MGSRICVLELIISYFYPPWAGPCYLSLNDALQSKSTYFFYHLEVESSAIVYDQDMLSAKHNGQCSKSYRLAFLPHRPSRTHTSRLSWLADVAGWPSGAPLSCGTLEIGGDGEVIWWFARWFYETAMINEIVMIIHRHGNSPPLHRLQYSVQDGSWRGSRGWKANVTC